jgi:hypothetical protein
MNKLLITGTTLLSLAVGSVMLTSCANDVANSPMSYTGGDGYPSYPNNGLARVEAHLPAAFAGGSEAYQSYEGAPTQIVMGGMDRTHLEPTGGDNHRDPTNGMPPGFNNGVNANAGRDSLALLAAMRNAEVTRHAHANPTDPTATPVRRN